jgi:predicted acyl esterase
MRVDDSLVAMTDGARVAVRLYRPDGPGPFPCLFAASPYRFDNDDVPETGMFLWHEIGPLRWYVAQGYAYARLDVRGSGRSEGDYGFFDRRERRDLYEVIEWLAAQPWSNGRVGGFGQSYYARSQWCMAAERPPHLACIAPYDGHIDLYGGWAYPGGIPSAFMPAWWNTIVRPINREPANGAPPREIACDLPLELSRHPTFDGYWEERDIAGALRAVEIPVYSIGVFAKRDLHLNGNVLGFQAVRGPKKLHLSGAATPVLAHKEFASTAFHERVLLPFYDHCLKGAPGSYPQRPAVEHFVYGAGRMAEAADWPPPGGTHERLYLDARPSGSVRSLNDGSLADAPPDGDGTTSYSYPDPHWAVGHVAFGPQGPDPVGRVLTFTSAPLPHDTTIAGPVELVLHLSSTRTDADVIVKLSEQRADASTLVTKGWLRASLRALDEARSTPGAPVLTCRTPQALVSGEIVILHVPLMPAAYRFSAGARIRIEIACADSPITESQFSHIYTPACAGTDTIHHSHARPSHLLLPLSPHPPNDRSPP